MTSDLYDSRPATEEATSGRARRLLPVLALSSLLLFAAIAAALSWRQYGDAKQTALNDARSRAVIAAACSTPTSRARSRRFRRSQARRRWWARARPRCARTSSTSRARTTPSTEAWPRIDRQGQARVSTSQVRAVPLADVLDRSYFATALHTGRPFVSEGLTSRTTHRQVIVTAVPTRDANGEITGVLAGTRLIKRAGEQLAIDRSRLQRSDYHRSQGSVGARRLRAPAQPGGRAAVREGAVRRARGYDGSGRRLGARSRVREGADSAMDGDTGSSARSEIFGDARRNLAAELFLIGGAVLIGIALLAWVIARDRSEARAQRDVARRRRLRYEEEHRVATTLQRSLLSGVQQIDAVDSAARYQAGSTGLEVGGDWYDVLQRPDGVILVTVGDVAGRGVAAAALMGQLRNAFRAYAYDHSSPAEIMWRLIRHMSGDQMATAVCIAIDPTLQEVAYASAGHPPALLRDDDSGAVTHLGLAQAPPLGFASPEAVRETRIALPRHATLIAYTDGVIERRGQVIDEGIERLESAFRAADPGATAAELADTVIRDVAEVTAADDDIAVLVMRFGDIAARFEPSTGETAQTR